MTCNMQQRTNEDNEEGNNKHANTERELFLTWTILNIRFYEERRCI